MPVRRALYPVKGHVRTVSENIESNLDWAKSYFLDKILISFGKDIRHKSSDSWEKVKNGNFDH